MNIRLLYTFILVNLSFTYAFSQEEDKFSILEKKFNECRNDTLKLNYGLKLLNGTLLLKDEKKFYSYYNKAKKFTKSIILKNNKISYIKAINADIECEIMLSQYYFYNVEYKKSNDILFEILKRPKIELNIEKYSKILNLISSNYYWQKEFKNSFYYNEKNILYSQKHNYLLGLAQSYNRMGYIYSEMGNSKKKYEFLYKTIEVCTKLKDNYRLSRSYLDLAMYFYDDEQYSRAKKYYEIALKTNLSRYPDIEGRIYYGMSQLYSSLGNYKKAMECSDKAITLVKDNDVPLSLANAKLAKGSLHKILGEFNDAIKIFNEAASIYMQYEQWSGVVNIANELGDSYRLLDSLQKSKNKYYSSVLPTAIPIYYKTTDKLQLALNCLKYAEKLNDKYGSNVEKLSNSMYQKKVYLAMGDYKKAFKMLDLEKRYNENIINENNKKIGLEKELEYKYKTKVANDSLRQIVLSRNNDLKVAKIKSTNYNLIFVLISICLVTLGLYFRFSYIKKIKELEYEEQKFIIEQKQKEIIETELNYLKSQINPHFLFNSLNTIFFKIEKTNKSAREAILGFSEILRYQLYDCNQEKVSIEKEIKYLEEYVRLQLVRMNEKCKCSFIVNDNVKDFNIAPLILITFVENAFKHLRNDRNVENKINIVLSKNRNVFNFEIENDKDKFILEKIDSGIGVFNTKRRLDLIYKEKHNLIIDNSSELYKVKLTITL